MKPYVQTKIHNSCEQIITIQSNSTHDGVEVYFSESDGTHQTGILYLDDDEVIAFSKKLQEMIDWLKIK
tara:strand:+ start:5766 stop:5972 length:207 start_codon:yes stop_codon:yes gene_type:complete